MSKVKQLYHTRLAGLRAIPIILATFLACVSCAKQANIDQKFSEANQAYQAHDTAKASQLYKEVISMDSSHTGARIMLGKIQFYDRDFSGAEKTFEEALSKNSSSIDALFWMAKAQNAMPARKNEARKNLDLVLARDSRHVEALVMRGILDEEENEIAKAMAAYRAATVEETKIAEAYARLAAIYGKADLSEMKRKALARAAILDPDFVPRK